MSRAGRGRGRGGYRAEGNRLKGLFMNGIWHCDCEPPQPASHFETKKPGPNRGRWFYTCQKSDPAGCKFFLWQEEASLREEGAILNNSRTEPRLSAVIGGRHNTPHEEPQNARTTISPPPAYSSRSRASAIAYPSRLDGELDFDDDDSWALSTSDMQQLEADAINKTPKTPAKRNFSALNESGLATPQTDSRMRSGQSTSNAETSKRRATEADVLDLVSPASTPTPLRFRDAVESSNDDALFGEIRQALSKNGLILGTDVLKAIKEVCTRQAMRTQGLVKGRDITRLSLKARDSKVTELQHRINTLEAELETERAIVAYLRSNEEADGE